MSEPFAADADWLVAIDDALCTRLRCCTACGRAEDSLRFEIWQQSHVPAVAIVLCHRCRGQGELMRERLQELLGQRYGGCRTA
jgi:hypothetical protein